jgi:hypothetical protein
MGRLGIRGQPLSKGDSTGAWLPRLFLCSRTRQQSWSPPAYQLCCRVREAQRSRGSGGEEATTATPNSILKRPWVETVPARVTRYRQPSTFQLHAELEDGITEQLALGLHLMQDPLGLQVADGYGVQQLRLVLEEGFQEFECLTVVASHGVSRTRAPLPTEAPARFQSDSENAVP